MIDLNPDTVENIAEFAREFQAMAAMEIADSPPGPVDDRKFEQLNEWHGDPGYLELKNAIEDLEPDQQATLLALMWLGRGDYPLEDWQVALAYASEVTASNTADYLITTPLLADYLEEGLSLQGYTTER